MKKMSKVLCSLLLIVAPLMVVGTYSLILWEETEIPESLK